MNKERKKKVRERLHGRDHCPYVHRDCGHKEEKTEKAEGTNVPYGDFLDYFRDKILPLHHVLNVPIVIHPQRYMN